jgi:hypothetical protein
MVSLVKVKLIKTLLNVTSFGNVLARRVKQKGVTVARRRSNRLRRDDHLAFRQQVIQRVLGFGPIR